MDTLLTLSWRAYPAGGLLVLGLALAVWGGCHGVSTAQREVRDPRRALALLQGFRILIIGLALAGIGAAWCWEIGWLLGLSMIIGGEELLESTVVITALRHETLREGAAVPQAP